MKTTNQNQGIKTVLVSILFTLSFFNSSAQKINKAIELASDVTGSGLGGNIYIGATLSHGNSAYSFGVNLQQKKINLSGIQLNYRYTVAHSENEKTELFFLGNVTCHANANVSDRSVKIEKMCRPEEVENYDALSLKVIESYVGFGLKYNLTQRFSTICSIGVGGYETLNNDYDLKMYRPKSALSLRFKIGLAYNFKK